MRKYRVYYYTNKEYSIDVEAESEVDAVKQAKENWGDGDEQSECFDDTASTEVEIL